MHVNGLTPPGACPAKVMASQADLLRRPAWYACDVMCKGSSSQLADCAWLIMALSVQVPWHKAVVAANPARASSHSTLSADLLGVLLHFFELQVFIAWCHPAF
jgi:hypothetical protein